MLFKILTRPSYYYPPSLAVSFWTSEHVSQFGKLLHHWYRDVQAVKGDSECLPQEDVAFDAFLCECYVEFFETQKSQQEFRI